MRVLTECGVRKKGEECRKERRITCAFYTADNPHMMERKNWTAFNFNVFVSDVDLPSFDDIVGYFRTRSSHSNLTEMGYRDACS